MSRFVRSVYSRSTVIQTQSAPLHVILNVYAAVHLLNLQYQGLYNKTNTHLHLLQTHVNTSVAATVVNANVPQLR